MPRASGRKRFDVDPADGALLELERGAAAEKARGLQELYGADEKTTGYFTLHTTADVYHSNVWKQQLGKRLQSVPEAANRALDAARLPRNTGFAGVGAAVAGYTAKRRRAEYR